MRNGSPSLCFIWFQVSKNETGTRNLIHKDQTIQEYNSSGQLGVDSEEITNLPQAGVNSESLIFSIPWGHNKLIIDKCKGNTDKALFFAKETLEHTWSRSALMNFLDTDLYDRQLCHHKGVNDNR